MARADLILSLVRAGASGDKALLRSTVDALAADERSKRHTVLADRLTRALNTSMPSTVQAVPSAPAQSGRDFLLEINPQRTLDSLVLGPDVRRRIDELVEEQHRADLLRSHGLQPRHRLLLAGPPGNGKTSLAEALAESLAVPLFSVRYDSLIGSFLGETNQRLRRLFDYIRTTPCVLLFDEFDALGKERGDVHETGEIKRVVSSLLLQIDALPSYVVLVAATNHEELLDRAAWRRFELRLRMPAPTEDDILAFLDRALGGELPIDRQTKVIFEQLSLSSYAEALDFALDVRRRQILSIGDISLQDALRERARLWALRMRVPVNGERSEQTTSDVRPSRSSGSDKGAKTNDPTSAKRSDRASGRSGRA